MLPAGCQGLFVSKPDCTSATVVALRTARFAPIASEPLKLVRSGATIHDDYANPTGNFVLILDAGGTRLWRRASRSEPADVGRKEPAHQVAADDRDHHEDQGDPEALVEAGVHAEHRQDLSAFSGAGVSVGLQSGRSCAGTPGFRRTARNAIGVVTDRAFFDDTASCKRLVERDLLRVQQALDLGRTVVVPAYVIGTGLSRLSSCAPRVDMFIKDWFRGRA